MDFSQGRRQRQVCRVQSTRPLKVTKLCLPQALLFFLIACSHTKENSITKMLRLPGC